MTYVSLKDVAALAGVSFQTASKVLNGKGAVSPDTRARTLGAAETLGYVPNALARSLLGKSTCTIGVLATDFSATTLAQVVVGIERAARRQGLCVIIGSVDRAGSDVERYLQALLERRVDGIITAAPITEGNPRVGELLRGRIPAVSTHEIAGGGIATVMPDNVQTASLPVRHLLALGHRRIGTITGSRERRVTHIQVRAYRQALAGADVPFEPELVEEGDWEVEGGYRAAHRLLDRAPDVTALAVQNDLMAVGVLSALHDRGRRVPEDCAVVGCDDLPLAAHTIPPLTTVHVPFYEVGETATHLLLDRIAAGGGEPQRILLPVHLVYRASAGGDRRSDSGAAADPPAVAASAVAPAPPAA